MLEDKLKFARKEVYLTAFVHFLGGLGLAIVLQNYLIGNPLLPVMVGWIFIVIAVLEHIFALTR